MADWRDALDAILRYPPWPEEKARASNEARERERVWFGVWTVLLALAAVGVLWLALTLLGRR